MTADQPAGALPRLSLTVLGSGSALPYPGRRPAAYALRYGSVTGFLDCGPGAFHTAAAYGCLDHFTFVLLTHGHIDHILDLALIAFAQPLARWWPASLPAFAHRPHVFASSATIAMLSEWWDAYPYLDANRLYWHPVTAGVPFEPIPGLSVLPGLVNHASESLAYRLTTPAGTIVYSGDTGWSDAFIQLAHAADLLVVECSHAKPSRHHLDPASVAAIGRLAGVHHILVSHFYPEYVDLTALGETFARLTAIPVSLAVDGLTLTLPPP